MGLLGSITGSEESDYQNTLENKISEAREAKNSQQGKLGNLAKYQFDMLRKINDLGLLIDDIKEREEWIVRNYKNGNHSKVRSSVDKIVEEIERQDLLKGDEHRIKEDVEKSREILKKGSGDSKTEQTVNYNVQIAKDFLKDVEKFREHVERQEPALKDIADNQGKVSGSEKTSFRRIHQEAKTLEKELIKTVNEWKSEY